MSAMRREAGGPRRTARVFSRVVRVAATLAATLVLLELGTWAVVRWRALPVGQPTWFETRYWRTNHPDFGVWRNPETSYRHTTRCFDATYRSNRVGARDRDRSLTSSSPRVVVLGDSFLEGWGLPEESRLSNQLETRTGVEHLNFAMAYFGPYQELLVYEHLASHYSHDAVLIGVLPANDFTDLDWELAQRRPESYLYHFRPYLVGDGPPYRHQHLRESPASQWLRRFTWSWNAWLFVRTRITAEKPRPSIAAQMQNPSFYYDFSDPQARLLEHVLGRLIDAAEGRRVAILLLPTRGDLLRWSGAPGAPPLTRRLEALARERGVRLVDLLPGLARRTRGWGSYFHACDYHWSHFANRAATDLVIEALGEEFYPRVEPSRRRP